MIVRSLVLLALAAAIAPVDHVLAQSDSVPLPRNGTTSIAPAVPTQSTESCLSDFASLRNDAEMKGRLIKVAGDRHAPPAEACRLIADYEQAEVRMMRYVEVNTAKCGIPPELVDRLKAAHRTTEVSLKKVCRVATQAQSARTSVFGSDPDTGIPRKGPVGDFDHLIGRPYP